MYGREPQLPIDKEFNLPNNREPASIDSYVERLLNKVDYAFQKAREIVLKMQQIGRNTMKNVRCHALEPGDIVLVRCKIFSTDYKIADKWEDEPYLVVSQMGDTPVFKVRLQKNPMQIVECYTKICCIPHVLLAPKKQRPYCPPKASYKKLML